MPFVYILFSASTDWFYIGATSAEVELRLEKHLSEFYGNAFTSNAKDWEIYFEISCTSMKQALQIERHIKNMKSRKYIQNLKAYPEMAEKLKEKYIA